MKGLLHGSISDLKTVLTSNGKVLGEVQIKHGIFQGDSDPCLYCCFFL